jgi:hypothetical protein
MSNLFKKFESGGIASVFILFLVIYVLYILYKYFESKSAYGPELMSKQSNKAYNNSVLENGGTAVSNQGVVPANPFGQNETYASVDGISTSNMPQNSMKIPNPTDLLPRDNNSEWAQLNPSGQGDLANINLLKAGYQIGIDTIGSSLRNANQQERSDPIIPMVSVGPWNQSSISPDFVRANFNIAAGGNP